MMLNRWMLRLAPTIVLVTQTVTLFTQQTPPRLVIPQQEAKPTASTSQSLLPAILSPGSKRDIGKAAAPRPSPRGKAAAPIGAMCPFVPTTLQWIAKPIIAPPAWQRFTDDLAGWAFMVETLDIDSSVTSEARTLQDEAKNLRDRDASIASALERVRGTEDGILRDSNTLGPQICAHNAEVERYSGQCLGRELPEPEYSRCTAWQGQLNARKANLDSQQQAILDHWTRAESTRTGLAQDQIALQARIATLNDKIKQQAETATDAARKRRAGRGYEIDNSSFVQLADKEPGWELVQTLLTNNRGRVFISPAAKAEALAVDGPTRVLARKALLQQWGITDAENDTPLPLVELFANLGVSAKGDAEIAASAWKHFRILITGNSADFRSVTAPNFPFLAVERTK